LRHKLLETSAVTALVASGFAGTATEALALPARFHIANERPAPAEAVMHSSLRRRSASLLILADDTTTGSGTTGSGTGSGTDTGSGSGTGSGTDTGSGSGTGSGTDTGSGSSSGGFSTNLPGDRVPQGGTLTIGAAQSGSEGFGDSETNRFSEDRDASAGDPDAARGNPLAFGNPDPVLLASLGLTLPSTSEIWAWGRFYAQHASVSGNGAANYEGTGLGGTGGFEMKPDADSLLGLALGFGHSLLKTDAGDKGSLDSYRLGIYSQSYVGPIFFGGTLNAAYNDGHARSAPDPLTHQYIEGSFGGYQLGISGMGGYRIIADGLTIEPWVGLEYERLHQDAFTERGPGFADLHVSAASTDTGRTRLASRFIKTFKVGENSDLRLQLQAGWAHDFLDAAPTVTQQIGGGTPFAVTGTKVGRDTAFAGLGATLRLNNSVDLAVDLAGDARDHETSQSVSAGIRIKW
jgi:hypothetical protein